MSNLQAPRILDFFLASPALPKYFVLQLEEQLSDFAGSCR